MKKIGIVGTGVFAQSLIKTPPIKKPTIVTEIPTEMNTIEINGETYQKIDRDSKASPRSRMLAMATLMMGGMYGDNSYERKRPNVDIVEEYKLIQEKKSKLCRSDRDWVVRTFNYNYKKI